MNEQMDEEMNIGFIHKVGQLPCGQWLSLWTALPYVMIQNILRDTQVKD